MVRLPVQNGGTEWVQHHPCTACTSSTSCSGVSGASPRGASAPAPGAVCRTARGGVVDASQFGGGGRAVETVPGLVILVGVVHVGDEDRRTLRLRVLGAF